MRKIILLFAISFVGFLSAQELKGIFIINEITKSPIASVSISTEDQGFQKISDENGFVSFQNFDVSKNKILVSAIGFSQEEFDLNAIKKENNFGYIFLNPSISSIEEVKLSKNVKNNIFQPISDLDIHLRPINNSQEILRSVPGLFIGQHAGGGKAEQLFIRGFDIDHGTDISLNVDGIPVNMPSHAHGQGYADLHFLIPEFVDKVNFNKGPYFADKGNFATAGFVDFKTKDNLESNFLKAEVGQFNTYRGVLGLNLLQNNQEIKTQSLYLGTEAYFTDGYFDNPQDFKRLNFILKYNGKLSENNFLTAYVSGLDSKWKASGQIPDRAVESGMIDWFGAIDPNEGGKTSRYNMNINLKTYLKNGAKLTNQFFYSKYKFELYSNFTFFLNDPINGDQIKQKEDRNIYGVNSTYEKSTTIFNLKSDIYAGIQFRYDDVNDLELSRTKDRTIITEALKLGEVNEANIGVFWAQKIYLNDKFDVTPAVRFDYFNNQYFDRLTNDDLKSNSNIFSPKLDFNYHLNDQVHLYSYWGKGFHSNDTRVAVLQNGKNVVPPAYGTDLGGVFKIGKNLLLQTAVWYLWLDQEFVYVGDEAVVEEGGKTQRFGLDITTRYEFLKNWFLDFNLSLAKPKSLDVPNAECYIPLAPTFVSTGGITYRKATGLNGSLRYRLMGDRAANEDKSVIAEGYFIWDGVINYTQKKWEVGLSVQNIFNTKWKETQFDTESRLYNEAESVSEIHFTPGTPFLGKLSFTYFF